MNHRKSWDGCGSACEPRFNSPLMSSSASSDVLRLHSKTSHASLGELATFPTIDDRNESAIGSTGSSSSLVSPPFASEDTKDSVFLESQQETSSGAAAAEATLVTRRKVQARRNAWGKQTYVQLISKAILSTDDERMMLSEIYDHISRSHEHFARLKDTNSTSGWKNSVRHNLSLHKNIFRKIPNEKEGKSCFWTVISDEKQAKAATEDPEPKEARSSRPSRVSSLKRRRRSSERKKQPLSTQVIKGGFDGMFQKWPLNKQEKVGPAEGSGPAVSWPNTSDNLTGVVDSGAEGDFLSETGTSGSTWSSYGSTGGFLSPAPNINSAPNYPTSALADDVPTEHSVPGNCVLNQDIPAKDRIFTNELMPSQLSVPNHAQNILTHQPSQSLVPSQTSLPTECAFQFPHSSVSHANVHEHRASHCVGNLPPTPHEAHTPGLEAWVVEAMQQQHLQQQQLYGKLNAGREPAQLEFIDDHYFSEKNIAQNPHGWSPSLLSQQLSPPVQNGARSFAQSHDPSQTATSMYQDAVNAERGMPPASQPQYHQVTASQVYQNHNTVAQGQVPPPPRGQVWSRSFPAVASPIGTQQCVAQSQQAMMNSDRHSGAVAHHYHPQHGINNLQQPVQQAGLASQHAHLNKAVLQQHCATLPDLSQMSLREGLDFHFDHFF